MTLIKNDRDWVRKIFYVITAVSFLTFANAQNSPFRHYTVNDGLANSMVYYAMQDSKGFMWFCTESGVNRFDGLHFETFTIKDGLADNENFRCIEDSKGRIWFASYNGRLCYYDGNTFVNEKTDVSLKQSSDTHNHIEDIIEDPKGNIWFSKFLTDYLYKYDGKKIKVITHKPINSNSGYGKFFFNYQGHVNYFRMDSAAIWREDPESGVSHQLTTKGINRWVSINLPRSYKINPNEFYFTSNMGLLKFSHDTVSHEVVNFDMDTKATIPILSFILLNNESWIIPKGNGIIRFPDFKNTKFKGTHKHYLSGQSIIDVTKDSDGGLWISTSSNGVYYLPPSASFIRNITGESITSITHSSFDCSIGVGTFYGEFMLLKNDSLILKYKFEKSISNRVKCMKWLSQSKILLGMDHSPYEYDFKKNAVTILYGEGTNGCSDIDEGEAGIWLKCRQEIVLWKNNTPHLIYGKNPVVSEKLISIAEGGKKGCWFTSINNLYWLDLNSKKKTLIAGNALFNSNLKNIRHIKGRLWVATDGNGIFIFENDKLIKHIYTNNTSLTSNVCQKLVYDGKDKMWVATNKGISVLDAFNYQFLFSLTTNDILINNDVKDIDLCKDKAYVATPAGISVIDINSFINKTAPPAVYVKDILIKDKKYNLNHEPEFYYSREALKLSYTAITYQSRGSLKYRYKFEAEGGNWNETSSDQLEFFDLAPGSYALLISAKKYNSDWSVPAIAKFTILPLWYQTTWFKALIVLAVICSVFLVTNLILKNKKRKVEVEKQIVMSELRAIRLHMNPHFIYNTLNSLQLFIFKNKSLEANAYIAKLSRLMRWIMSYSEKQDITLEEEIEFLKTYVDLEQLRFEVPFKLELTLDETLNAKSTYIPPLIIQPFVENAIKYGLAEKREAGLLKIRFEKKGGLIFATIEDNGAGREKVKKEQALSMNKTPSTGIKFTEERLKLLFRDLHVKNPLKITDLYSEGLASGTKIEVQLPIFE